MKRINRAVVIAAIILLSFAPSAAYAADYIVQPADSLYKIGQLFKVPIATLKQDNFLDKDAIYPGQVLYVPAKIYTVRSGDSLYRIAKQYSIPLASLRKANNKWNDFLQAGQVLALPGIAPAGGSGTVISYARNEVDLLARLIRAEAGNESYQAMVGVGAVVVNRVQSPDWPSGITSVINQVINGYYQFTPVKNGTINNPPSDSSLRAAWAALYGSDPSNGAIFYFDDSSTNQWMWSRPRTAYIGSMVFVK